MSSQQIREILLRRSNMDSQGFPAYARSGGRRKTEGSKKQNSWIDFVNKFAKENNMSYGEALKVAGPYYEKYLDSVGIKLQCRKVCTIPPKPLSYKSIDQYIKQNAIKKAPVVQPVPLELVPTSVPMQTVKKIEKAEQKVVDKVQEIKEAEKIIQNPQVPEQVAQVIAQKAEAKAAELIDDIEELDNAYQQTGVQPSPDVEEAIETIPQGLGMSLGGKRRKSRTTKRKANTRKKAPRRRGRGMLLGGDEETIYDFEGEYDDEYSPYEGLGALLGGKRRRGRPKLKIGKKKRAPKRRGRGGVLLGEY